VIYDLRFMIYGISESRLSWFKSSDLDLFSSPQFVSSGTVINYFQPPRSQRLARRTQRFFKHEDREGQNEGLKGFYFAIAASSVFTDHNCSSC
jgi:hypothetical protein